MTGSGHFWLVYVVALLASAAAYDKSGWLKDHMAGIVAEQCGKSPHKDEIAGDVGTQPSLAVNICVAGMPCGDKTDKQTLRTAYQYCEGGVGWAGMRQWMFYYTR
jgi:hypothetical protein